jgi:hypothetical protein
MEEKSKYNTRYLIRQPLALQWFDNGKLCKRSEEERQASKHCPTVQPQDNTEHCHKQAVSSYSSTFSMSRSLPILRKLSLKMSAV